MDVIQYSAWSIDRAIEVSKVKGLGKDTQTTDIIADAKSFAEFMNAAIDKSDEIEKMIEGEVTARLEVELSRIKAEESNGLN